MSECLGGVKATAHNVVNFTLLPLLSLLLLLSCSKFTVSDTYSTDSTVATDSTVWRSLQGFWRVEAIHFDEDTTFSAPEDPNFIEITGDTIRQFYLVNAPKDFNSTPNRAELEEIYSNIITLKAPDTLYLDDFPLECTFNADSSRVTLRAKDRGWRAERSEFRRLRLKDLPDGLFKH